MKYPNSYLGNIVHDTLHTDTPLAKVIDMELKVSAIHKVHHQAQVHLIIVGISQINDEAAVGLFQYLLLYEGEPLAAFSLQPPFIQFFAGINLACVSSLYSTNLQDRIKMDFLFCMVPFLGFYFENKNL